jgi:RNA 2',3'-cyclic 3'-phosphodiesterase
MRAFIAIELPQQVKDRLSRIQARLKKSEADVKWVQPQNIHLTLKFLGEIDEILLEKIKEILINLAKDNAQFQIVVSYVGAFPSLSSARVIWVGLKEGDEQTKALANGLEERIEKIGIPREERAFSSHITIGRARSGLNRDKLTQELKILGENFWNETEGLQFCVDKITLLKSTLTPKGPIYEILKEASLKTT